MSNGEVRTGLRQAIQLVQNHIEHCLQLYMNQREVMDTLSENAKIEPAFTELVWQRLEEENGEFFKAYHVRLMLKNQIIAFNKLLQWQVELMHAMHSDGAAAAATATVSLLNDSNPSLRQTPSCYAPAPSGLDNIPCPVDPSSALTNGGPSSIQSMPIADATSFHVEGMDLTTSSLSIENSRMGTPDVLNGRSINMEPNYSSNSEFTLCTNGSFSGRSTMGDAPMPFFNSTELNAQPLNEPVLEIDSSSFGILDQIPRDFTFSDLAEDFAQGTDIWENYGRSPFLEAESNSISGSTGREHEGENKKDNTISEGVSRKDLGRK